jgi:putative transcriptional regulator
VKPGLCALMLLCAVACPTSVRAAKPPTAILLVAHGIPPESDFSDSVVLVMNNLGPAPVGIIVNRPSPIPVSDVFPDLKRLEQLRDRLYFGGPVELESVWFLLRATKPPEHSIQALDDLYLSADRELLRRLLSRDKPMDGLRIFIGHAGWAPGQLEHEIDLGAWNLERADADAVFNGGAERPWPDSGRSVHYREDDTRGMGPVVVDADGPLQAVGADTLHRTRLQVAREVRKE